MRPNILGAVAILTLTPLAAKAAFIVDITQVGANVVASGSGSIDTTDLTNKGSGFTSYGSAVSASDGWLYITPGSVSNETGWQFSGGPTSFGSGGLHFASSETGDSFVFQAVGGDQIYLPSSYVSGSALSDTETWDTKTIASLGLTPGTYTWTWGNGADADSFTLQIGAVPEPATLSLLGAALVGIGAVRRRGKRSA
jgi:hypothetical protein